MKNFLFLLSQTAPKMHSTPFLRTVTFLSKNTHASQDSTCPSQRLPPHYSQPLLASSSPALSQPATEFFQQSWGALLISQIALFSGHTEFFLETKENSSTDSKWRILTKKWQIMVVSIGGTKNNVSCPTFPVQWISLLLTLSPGTFVWCWTVSMLRTRILV